jgi:uncharacterized protein YjbI with pentapeptide repeats
MKDMSEFERAARNLLRLIGADGAQLKQIDLSAGSLRSADLRVGYLRNADLSVVVPGTEKS